MKTGARILKFHGKDVRTASDLTAAMEALMSDIVTGRITRPQAKTIQKQINARIKAVEAALKKASQFDALRKLLAEKETVSLNIRQRSDRERRKITGKENNMNVLDDKIIGFRIGSEDVCRECVESEEEDNTELDQVILADDDKTDWLFCDRCKTRIK